ncbi:MAG: permease [Burkholderiaceae bacterium]|nr:permease [Burkholderiaceae bacterium]MBU6366679.1 permease [Gemmatimonadota bacterium]
MLMTHYMELLASNQPWNLLIFMALPVVLAETVAITELYILYTRKFDTWVRQVNRIASILVGITFVGIIAYLMFTAVIPITSAGAWRTWIDVVAVSTYLIGGVPMVLLALQELGLIHRAESEERRLARHATYVAVFLVFAHIAMVAGMMDPGILGYVAPAESHDMMNHH